MVGAYPHLVKEFGVYTGSAAAAVRGGRSRSSPGSGWRCPTGADPVGRASSRSWSAGVASYFLLNRPREAFARRVDERARRAAAASRRSGRARTWTEPGRSTVPDDGPHDQPADQDDDDQQDHRRVLSALGAVEAPLDPRLAAGPGSWPAARPGSCRRPRLRRSPRAGSRTSWAEPTSRPPTARRTSPRRTPARRGRSAAGPAPGRGPTPAGRPPRHAPPGARNTRASNAHHVVSIATRTANTSAAATRIM